MMVSAGQGRRGVVENRFAALQIIQKKTLTFIRGLLNSKHDL